MLNKNELLQLMKATAKADRSAPVAYSFGGENLSYEALNETLRAEMNELAGTYALYRENKNLIFSLIEEVITTVLPAKVTERYAEFAEVKTYKQGDKPVYTIRGNYHQRAKQFVTRVGNAGIYEVWKLGKERPFELGTSSVGTAVQIGFEEFLDGRVDFAMMTQIVMEGIDELIYREIGQALITSIEQLPVANRVEAAGFEEEEFDRLIMVASQYGTPTIYCTREFAVKIVPETGWISDAMRDERWRNGYFATYKGTRVVIMPQGFTDESNSKKVIDPGYCWIIPSGYEKPVKVAFEGDTIVDEFNNYDRSREIQVYKKVGVGVIMTPDICVYTDTDLLGKFDVVGD